MVQRLVQALPVLLLAAMLVFGLLQLVPGDPAATLAGEYATAERIAQIRTLYGLDKPVVMQFLTWLAHAGSGDLGRSFLSGEEVLAAIQHRLPTTLLFVAGGLLLSVVVGVPLGLSAARRPGTTWDSTVSSLASLGVALPGFWLGMILASIFALGLHWLPATGAASLLDDPWEAVRHAALPSMALAAGGIAEVASQVRSALIEVLGAPHIRTLHAKGLSSTAIFWKHGLRNISVTLLTVVGLVANRLLGATVVTEAVFAVPGMGSLMVQAAINKDFPVVQGCMLVMVLMVIGINMVVDLMCVAIDPRAGAQ